MAKQLTDARIKKMFQRIEDSVLVKANRRALSRTITAVRKVASQEVREVINLKAKDIKNTMSITRPRGRDLERMMATLKVEPKPVPLVKYGARQTKRGITVKIKRGGSRQRVSGGFFATVGAGHKGIFKRKGRKRLPIKELFSSSVRQVFNNKGIQERVMKEGRETFVKNFKREFSYILERDVARKLEKLRGG